MFDGFFRLSLFQIFPTTTFITNYPSLSLPMFFHCCHQCSPSNNICIAVERSESESKFWNISDLSQFAIPQILKSSTEMEMDLKIHCYTKNNQVTNSSTKRFVSNQFSQPQYWKCRKSKNEMKKKKENWWWWPCTTALRRSKVTWRLLEQKFLSTTKYLRIAGIKHYDEFCTKDTFLWALVRIDRKKAFG